MNRSRISEASLLTVKEVARHLRCHEDTVSNAGSALMGADPRMEEYLAGAGPDSTFYTSAVEAGELEFGIARLEKGRKRRELERALETVLGMLADVLVMGLKTSRTYGGLKAELWRRGKPWARTTSGSPHRHSSVISCS